MGNISYRLGKTLPAGEIAERIGGRKELGPAFDKMRAHLDANGIDLKATPAALGPLLTMDPQAERFMGEFAAEANALATRPYRAPFVVPEKV